LTTETQLELPAEPEPPVGLLGCAVNAVFGDRIAEAGVHRFIADVAQDLRDRLQTH
jgi:hypothetical protein